MRYFRPQIVIQDDGLTIRDWQSAIDWVKANGVPAAPNPKHQFNADSKETVTDADRPLTVPEVAELYGIDLNVFEASRIVTNKWEVAMKMDGAGKTQEVKKSPLWQTKVFWRLKTAPDLQAIKDAALQSLVDRQPVPDYTPLETEGLIAEIIIADHHIGKVAANGEEWGVEGAARAYRDAIEYFRGVMPGGVDRIILPTGNDFIHVDNLRGQTTKGTQVEAATDWFKMLVAGKELVVEAVQSLSDFGHIYVPFVCGNHDRNTTLALGEIVSAQFDGHPGVTVLNGLNDRKYLCFDSVVIGWSHLENFSYKGAATNVLFDLRGIPGAADAKHVYFRCGHLHKSSRAVAAVESDEMFKVEIEVCPTLCPADRWHEDNGYASNHRRSTMFVYHPVHGLVAKYYYNL